MNTGQLFLYHPSKATILAPRTNTLAVLRTTAPSSKSDILEDQIILDEYFHDAIPKYMGTSLVPVLHGKVLLATSKDGTG